MCQSSSSSRNRERTLASGHRRYFCSFGPGASRYPTQAAPRVSGRFSIRLHHSSSETSRECLTTLNTHTGFSRLSG